MTKQFNVGPNKASTVVVHPTPGIGDATTIQEALDMLPAEGGSILVREGTYSLAATITLPDKPVVIDGCGDGTIVSLGANAIAAFTAPNGLTATRRYVFSDFKVVGTSVVNQRIWSTRDDNSRGQIFADRVDSSGVQYVVEVIGIGSSTQVLIEFNSCQFIPINTGVSNRSAIVKFVSVGTGQYTLLRMSEVDFQTDDTTADQGNLATPSAGNALTLIAHDCRLTNSGGQTTATGPMVLEDCLIKDFTTFAPRGLTIGNSFNGLYQSSFVNVHAVRQSFGFSTANIVGGVYHDSSISLSQGSLVDAQFDATAAEAGIISLVLQGRATAHGCYFIGEVTGITGIYMSSSACIASGCIFDFFDNGDETAAIQIDGGASNCLVENCIFRSFDPAVPTILELPGANLNRFDNNTYLIGAVPAVPTGAATSINNENTRTVAVNTTLDETFWTVLVNATGAARTITLPTAASAKFRKYTIKKVDATANTVTIDAAGAETIDGALTLVFAAQYEWATIQSDGTSWNRIS